MAVRHRALGAAHLTLALAVVLGVTAALIGVKSPAGPIVALEQPDLAVIGMLTLLFFLGEYVLLNIEFRREAHSLTLAGVPMVLAVLVAPAHTAILARVVGALVALILQRIEWQKVLYNIAGYAFEIAVSSTLVRVIVGPVEHLDTTTFAVLLLVVVAVDQLMSALVLGIIGLHGGLLGRSQIVDVLVTSLALSVMTTAFATAIVLLINLAGALGAQLVVIVAAVATAAYRGYALTRRRHQSLELTHSFVADGVGAESVTALAEQLLTRIRTLMNAGTAELRMFEPGPGPNEPAASRDDIRGRSDMVSRMIVSEDQAFQTVTQPTDPADWLALRVRTENEPALLARDAKDRAVRAWLTARGLRDAVIVPLPRSQEAGNLVPGLVVVSDRLGETSTFTDDDVSLLQTLTGHLAVALHSTQLVEKLGYDASHDSLTGLYNRSHLTACIHRALSGPPADGSGIAVLLLDLDNFKDVNDTLGHDAGDLLLQIVAKRLISHTPGGATVARLGGDEFAILLPEVRGGQQQALDIARQIAGSLAQPVHLDEARLDIQISVGVAFTTDADPTADLLRQADTAMYDAKSARVPVSVYDAEMDRLRTERLKLLIDLRAALRSDPDQFVLHFQPKIDLTTDAVVGAEALVRWEHPRLGLINPDLFIPLAEATGLIDELTPLLLHGAMAECARWTAQGHRISVAVNLSARNIENAQLPTQVAAALHAHRLDPAQLILEITESMVMGDPKYTRPILAQLHDLGVGLSLDDFGTGHSSLSYLQQLPVNEVKIDRSFVLGLDSTDPTNSRALIRSIAGLSKNLGLRVVAEGVEDENRLAELRELGCDVAQGYYISRPLCAPDISSWLSERAGTRTAPVLRLVNRSALL